ncbi:MAG: DUF3054 family protein [Chloroflexota bacterium]
MGFRKIRFRLGGTTSTLFLVIGDLVALAVLTFIGFAAHGETDASFLPRMGLTFLAQAIAWFALAFAMGLLDASRAGRARPLWRPALTGFFAAQLAVNLRGLALGSAVQPVFALVLGATTALGMTLWRWIARRVKRNV